MTEPAAPPTPKTPEQLLAQLIELLASILYAVIDASHLPGPCRRRLRAAFAAYFASLAALLATPGQPHVPHAASRAQSRATPCSQPAKPPAQTRIQRRQTTPIQASAPSQTPSRQRPPYPTRARPSPTACTTANPRNFQKPAQTASNSRAQFITISKQNSQNPCLISGSIGTKKSGGEGVRIIFYFLRII